MINRFVKIGQFIVLAIVFLALVASDSWAQSNVKKEFTFKGYDNYYKFSQKGWIEKWNIGFKEVNGRDEGSFQIRNTSPIDVQMTVSGSLTVAKGKFEFTLFNGDGSVAGVLKSQVGKTVTKKFEAKNFGKDFKFQIKAENANNVKVNLNFRPN
ncbi:MAG: hypothetical protein LBI10_03965 [Deltaproteobacteria bacterium]|jgi:hypothetical protein|nr:hypothetical protein [Deltaproteobacteria bacterium]